MNYREKAEEIFVWGMSQRHDDGVLAWRNHSYGAAEVAGTIAEKAGLDADKAYAMGLLHDIGRMKGPHTGMNHIIDGYEILKEQGMPEEIARVCLTHSFESPSKVTELKLDDVEKDNFVKNYLKNTEFDDYDKLAQLADFMSGAHGVTTIERRFCSVLIRHGLETPREDLLAIYDLKEYFNQKIGMDVYELFHDKIADTIMRGIPGRHNTDANLEEEFNKANNEEGRTR